MQMRLKLTAAELRAVMKSDFPSPAADFELVSLSAMSATLRMPVTAQHLRPGNTVSGPVLFTLADVAFYAATLGMIGPKLLTVTTNANINFLRRPIAKVLVARAHILKLGKQLSVGEVYLHAEAEPDVVVAHATMTYSIPPEMKD